MLDNISLPMQTYRHAVIEPGARLNLVLGPNGEQRHLLLQALGQELHSLSEH